MKTEAEISAYVENLDRKDEPLGVLSEKGK